MGRVIQKLLLGISIVLVSPQVYEDQNIFCPICVEKGNGPVAGRYEDRYYYQYDPTWNSCEDPEWTSDLTGCIRITIAPINEIPETFHIPFNMLIGLPKNVVPLETDADQIIKGLYIDSENTKFLFEFCWQLDCSSTIKSKNLRTTPATLGMLWKSSSFGHSVSAILLVNLF